MSTSMINLGTAIGTGITAAAMTTSLGELAAPVVGAVFAVLTFVPLGMLVIRGRRPGTTPAPSG